ncbi:conserved hypothetical protein [Ricinus communis]|uniref:Uncharacterized protein n=1 Tax=Ricinus communis TaxID=3988 RepID=B9T8W3_RICCO|nr:conserved hypothetical protein [Ricinus communis]
MRPSSAGGIRLTRAQIRLHRVMRNLGPPYVNLLVEKKSSPLDIRKVKRRGSLHPIDSKSQYLHVPLLFVLEQHRRTVFHPCSSTSRRRSFSTEVGIWFADKSIIEGLEAGSLTHQFLLLPMGAFTSKGAWSRGGGWDSISRLQVEPPPFNNVEGS